MQTPEYFPLRDVSVMESLVPILSEAWWSPLATHFGEGYSYSRNYAWRGQCDWGQLLGSDHLRNHWGMPTYPTDRWLVGGIEFAVAIVPCIKVWIHNRHWEEEAVIDESLIPIDGYLLDHLQLMDDLGINVLILSYTAYSRSPIRIARPSHCKGVWSWSSSESGDGDDPENDRYFRVVDISASWSPESFLAEIGDIPPRVTRYWMKHVERHIRCVPRLVVHPQDEMGMEVLAREPFREISAPEDRAFFRGRVSLGAYLADPFISAERQEKIRRERERCAQVVDTQWEQRERERDAVRRQRAQAAAAERERREQAAAAERERRAREAQEEQRRRARQVPAIGERLYNRVWGVCEVVDTRGDRVFMMKDDGEIKEIAWNFVWDRNLWTRCK